MVKIGDIIEITTDNYGKRFIGKKCNVTHVAYNKEQHPGYDEGVNKEGSQPMALVDTDCKKLGSLYEWEFDVISNMPTPKEFQKQRKKVLKQNVKTLKQEE